MAADEHVDSVIAALKIIAKVPRNGKLCVRKGQLCLDTEDSMQSVRRWMRGDGRDVTLLHARNTINSAMKISKTLVLALSASATGSHDELSLWGLQRLCDEMQQCDVGLQNLRTTYAGDSMMVANLDVLCDRLRAHTSELRRFLATSSLHTAPVNNLVISSNSSNSSNTSNIKQDEEAAAMSPSSNATASVPAAGKHQTQTHMHKQHGK